VEDELVTLARRAQARAYSPYSRYRVGAAIEGIDGQRFAGCNVENASYGLTICAERVAAGAAVAAGVRQFRRVAIVTDSDPPAPPCGACRQFLREFGPDLVVDSVGPQSHRRWSLGELLPDAFGSELLA